MHITLWVFYRFSVPRGQPCVLFVFMYSSYCVFDRGLQQSLTRLLSDIQQFQPKELVKTGMLDAKSVVINGLNAHGAKTM